MLIKGSALTFLKVKLRTDMTPVCVQVVPAVDAMAGDISEPEEEEGSSATSSSASIELDRAVPRPTLQGMPPASGGKK